MQKKKICFLFVKWGKESTFKNLNYYISDIRSTKILKFPFADIYNH